MPNAKIEGTTDKGNKRLGCLRAVLLTGALFAMGLAPSAKGSTIYTYTGNAYTTCGGTYCSGGPYALSVTFTTTLTGSSLASLPFTDISATVTSFTFTDGSGLTVQESLPYFEFEISTNASGDISTWLVAACGNTTCDTQMQTNWDSPFGFNPGADFSETTASFAGNYGMNFANPGTWGPSTIPEPSTFVLLATSLLVFATVLARRAWSA